MSEVDRREALMGDRVTGQQVWGIFYLKRTNTCVENQMRTRKVWALDLHQSLDSTRDREWSFHNPSFPFKRTLTLETKTDTGAGLRMSTKQT